MDSRNGGGPVTTIGKRQSDLKKSFKLAVRSLLSTCPTQVLIWLPLLILFLLTVWIDAFKWFSLCSHEGIQQSVSKVFKCRARTSPPAFYSGLHFCISVLSGLSFLLILGVELLSTTFNWYLILVLIYGKFSGHYLLTWEYRGMHCLSVIMPSFFQLLFCGVVINCPFNFYNLVTTFTPG